MATSRLSLLIAAFVVTHADAAPPAQIDYGMPAKIAERLQEPRTEEGERSVSFSHDDHPAWATGENVKHSFRVILPKKPRPKMPMLVILHSVGAVELGDRQYPWSPYHKLDEWGYQLIFSQSRGGKAGWWGHNEVSGDPAAYADRHGAEEKRILSTVHWIADKYGIDRDRIYLSGVSMGGSGVLGNGMGRGDVFAAVRAIVPANHQHFDVRTKDPGIPDPPPLIYLYSQNDVWSRGHRQVRQQMIERHIALFSSWGPNGHAYYDPLYHESVIGLPWLSIKRNEAYPVFTETTTDDVYPGGDAKEYDPFGQTNGYFRWKVISDTPSRFEIELRLITAEELTKTHQRLEKDLAGHAVQLNEKIERNPNHGPTAHHLRLIKPYLDLRAKRGEPTPPAESTAHVALRRLQKLTTKAGDTFAWRLVRDEKTVAQGQAQIVDRKPLSVGRLTVTSTPARLTIERR